MKLYPDAIFIGAINYDYIFQSKNKEEKNHLTVEKKSLIGIKRMDHLMIKYRNCMRIMTLRLDNLEVRHI